MKEEKPKLQLNKRTIARLNNLEMRYVRGGDGDEVSPTRKNCGDLDQVDAAQQVAHLLMSMMVKVC